MVCQICSEISWPLNTSSYIFSHPTRTWNPVRNWIRNQKQRTKPSVDLQRTPGRWRTLINSVNYYDSTTYLPKETPFPACRSTGQRPVLCSRIGEILPHVEGSWRKSSSVESEYSPWWIGCRTNTERQASNTTWYCMALSFAQKHLMRWHCDGSCCFDILDHLII